MYVRHLVRHLEGVGTKHDVTALSRERAKFSITITDQKSSEMVHCVVVIDRSPRNTKKGISCHRFPLKDESQLSEWLTQIKRENMPPLENCHICSAHFEPSCFEDDFTRSKVMPESARKRHLKDAIPTVFAHKKRRTQRSAKPKTESESC